MEVVDITFYPTYNLKKNYMYGWGGMVMYSKVSEFHRIQIKFLVKIYMLILVIVA